MPPREDRTLRSRSEVARSALGLALWSAAACLAGPAEAQEPGRLYELTRVTQVTFEDAARRTLARNPTVLQAVEELGRAQALVEETRAPSLPSLAFNGVFTQLDGARVLNGTVLEPATQINLNLQLTVPLILPQRWAQWAHSKDQVAVARIGVGEVQRQLAIAVGHTYLSLLAQHSLVDLDETAVTDDQAHAQYTEARYKGGFGNRIDSVRAQQQVEADKVTLENAVAQLVRYREALGVLLAADEPLDVDGAVNLGPAPELSRAVDDSQSRSDVEESRLRLVASRHVARDDYADYLPTLNAVGFPFYQAPPTAELPRWGWQIQLILAWQIYDGGLRYGLAHERARLQREAELGLEASARQASSDVRTAFDSLARAQRAVTDALAAAQLAGSGLQLATLAYRAGASTNIEVIDAERVNHDAATQVVVAEDNAQQALFDLLTASGRIPGAEQR
jgi:outer membrane protein TolC